MKKEKKELMTLDLNDELLTQTIHHMAKYHLSRHSLLLDDAPDLEQNVFLKILQMKENKKREVKNPGAFLFVIVRNELNTLLKNKLSNREMEIEELREGQLSELQIDLSFADYSFDSSEYLLSGFCEILNISERNILQLMIFEYKANEIAFRLGISPDTARQKIHRIRTKLRTFLDCLEQYNASNSF